MCYSVLLIQTGVFKKKKKSPLRGDRCWGWKSNKGVIILYISANRAIMKTSFGNPDLNHHNFFNLQVFTTKTNKNLQVLFSHRKCWTREASCWEATKRSAVTSCSRMTSRTATTSWIPRRRASATSSRTSTQSTENDVTTSEWRVFFVVCDS